MTKLGNPPLNIVLIGMPGVGKSTVGVVLAKRLGLSYLDTDISIQTGESQSLQEIIARRGISGFCALEERYILAIRATGHVIATGGSVIYSPQAMQHLGSGGVIIYLDLTPANLKKRLGDLKARGVIIAPGQNIESLYNERHPLYRRYAEITVKTDDLSLEQVVEEITASVRGRRKDVGRQRSEDRKQ
ncbi:MAG: shikimate kinase [Desulfobacterales bacterium]|nr:MAG: shikimate kinase [Desulfobacterales bacterium]